MLTTLCHVHVYMRVCVYIYISLCRETRVRSLRLLEEQQTYEIICARDIGNGTIHLILKSVADNVKFICLLFRDLSPHFLNAVQQLNNGKAAGLRLTSYGTTSYGKNPIIAISNKRCTRILA